MQARRLFVGVGSPHGDDRVGWLVADRVADRMGDAVSVRSARSPAELLNWIDRCDILIVCDAMMCDLPPGSWRSWNWPASDIARARFSGSHDLSLAAALALADRLGHLPTRVEIWGVSIENALPNDDLSPPVAAAAPEVADRICGALCHA
jgi:hydrogenase maturation protease